MLSKCSDSSLSLTICGKINISSPFKIPTAPWSAPFRSSSFVYLLQSICNGDWLRTGNASWTDHTVGAHWLMDRASNRCGSRVAAVGRIVGVAIIARDEWWCKRAKSVVTAIATRWRDLNWMKRRPPAACRVCPASIQMKNPNRVVFHALLSFSIDAINFK